MTRAARKRYHYIYRTTCKVTGKYYIGMHSTNDLQDGYMGSGKRLRYSIGKHGAENHTCEILEFYFTREWLCEREAELVNGEILTDPLCMNIKLGGTGGFDYINSTRTTADYQRLGQLGGRASATLFKANPEIHARMNAAALPFITEKYINLWKNNRDFMLDRAKKASDLALSDEARAKRSATFASIGHAQGEKNSQYGTCWVNDGKTDKKIKKENIESYLETGWVRGRVKKK